MAIQTTVKKSKRNDNIPATHDQILYDLQNCNFNSISLCRKYGIHLLRWNQYLASDDLLAKRINDLKQAAKDAVKEKMKDEALEGNVNALKHLMETTPDQAMTGLSGHTSLTEYLQALRKAVEAKVDE